MVVFEVKSYASKYEMTFGLDDSKVMEYVEQTSKLVSFVQREIEVPLPVARYEKFEAIEAGSFEAKRIEGKYVQFVERENVAMCVEPQCGAKQIENEK